MMTDNRNSAEAVAGLLSMPTSVIDQMDDRHGKFQSRLGLFGHLLSGNDKSTYGDADLQAQYKTDKAAYDTQQARQLLGQQFEGLDMNNLSMADVATITQLDPGLGKLALENFTFGQRVDDLGRAQGFMNDGVDDENDLWAAETFGRYGKTAGGETTSLDTVLGNAKMTREEFKALPAEAQRAVLYQHGTDEDRATMDRVAGRKTIEQIESEGAAQGIGEASGKLTAEAIGFIPNAPQIAKDQDFAIAGAQGVIDLLKGGDINTGKWENMVKETFNIQTKADGTLGYQATQALIQQINSATFGALSEKEIETLQKMFANGAYNEEQNLGVMEGVMGKLKHEQEKHKRKTQESLRRVKDYAPDEYDHFMQDDENYLTYGEGSQRENIGDQDYQGFYRKLAERGMNRDQIDIQWNELRKRTEAREAEAKKLAEEQAAQAEQARKELSPYIRRPQ